MSNFGPDSLERRCAITGSKISPELCAKRQQCGSIACAMCEYGEQKKEEEAVGIKKPTCSIKGCEKQAWKEGMCYKHFHQKQRAQVVAETEQKAVPLPELNKPVRMSLLDRIPIIDTPLSRPGFYLDFTGKEDLLEAFKNMSTDLNNDTLRLIELSIAGVLGRVA